MMTKQAAIKRFVTYCNKKSSPIIRNSFSLKNGAFEIDDQCGKIRVFIGTKTARMIIFHTKHSSERNASPAISEHALTQDEYNQLKNEYEKQ
mgnify:FL=1